MSGAGAPDQKPVDCHDLRVAVVAASWHTQVMDGLLDGALRACARLQGRGPDRGPGARRLRAAGRRPPPSPRRGTTRWSRSAS